MEVLPEQPVTQQPGRQVCHKHQRRVEKHLSPGATADTDEHKRACYECRKNFRPRQQTIFHVICCPPLQSAPTSPEGEDWLLVDAIQHLVWSRRDCANALNIPNMDTICTLYKHPIRFFGAFVSELCSFKKKKSFSCISPTPAWKSFQSSRFQFLLSVDAGVLLVVSVVCRNAVFASVLHPGSSRISLYFHCNFSPLCFPLWHRAPHNTYKKHVYTTSPETRRLLPPGWMKVDPLTQILRDKYGCKSFGLT